jgi:succinate dehydrogenase / fumarate reductase cytochrome b subunit
VKLAMLVFLWAYLHHFCAGIRYLFLDIDKGADLAATRKTSYAVLAASLVSTAFLAVKLW